MNLVVVLETVKSTVKHQVIVEKVPVTGIESSQESRVPLKERQGCCGPGGVRPRHADRGLRLLSREQGPCVQKAGGARPRAWRCAPRAEGSGAAFETTY